MRDAHERHAVVSNTTNPVSQIHCYIFPFHCITVALRRHHILRSFPPSCLWPRLALIPCHRMQHDLIHRLRRVDRIPFAPIIANAIRKDVTRPIEIRSRDRASHFWIPF